MQLDIQFVVDFEHIIQSVPERHKFDTEMSFHSIDLPSKNAKKNSGDRPTYLATLYL